MHSIIRTTLIVIFIFLFFVAKAQKSAPVDKILKQVTAVLDEVETKTDLPAKKVNITFETEIERESEIGIKILIFKFGRKWLRSQSNEVTYNFELVPEKAFTEEPIKEVLTNAIKEAYQELAKVDNSKAKIKVFTLKVSFVIEKSSSIEGEYEILPITPSLGRSWKKKAVHTIEIEFGGNEDDK